MGRTNNHVHSRPVQRQDAGKTPEVAASMHGVCWHGRWAVESLVDACRLVQENTATAAELARREEQEAAERWRARAAVRNALSKQVRLLL